MRNFQTDPEWEARGEGRVAAVFSNKIDLFDGRNPHDDSSSPNKLQLSHLFSSPYGGATRILLANYIVDMEFVIDEVGNSVHVLARKACSLSCRHNYCSIHPPISACTPRSKAVLRRLRRVPTSGTAPLVTRT
eukprot:GHVU01053371.1.p1 GENE.GHVU01053371.1~~GHVU01053371.1.p1  ORF type:complete len:133 (-),score=6.68 GHVU01053371.1:327-725(-)